MPWEKGKSGNPKGRAPNQESLAGIMRELLEEKRSKKGRKTKKRALLEKVFTKAIGGDVACMRMIWEYYDGKPKQQIEIGHSKLDDIMEQFGKV